ncbi:MAG: hypothetical protein JWO19_2919 [Bryobacterales bacterium]|nr:hypothetical protein [Bryobacterales bacterium]
MKQAILIAVLTAALAAGQGTPVPKFTGPIPVTADSYPFMDAAHSLVPFDLAKYGYVEQEFIVSGTANVYDWAADGSLSVKTEKAPYGTRILVRRPANAARFSGAVVVEPMGAVRRFDWAIMYGYLNEHMMERGDAWVGITMPASSDGLKKFNPTRYTAVNFANPNPGEACPAAKGGPSAIEEGLRWDMMSQVGALLKAAPAGSPFAGFRVEALYMTSQFPDVVTYLDAIHSHARLANGKPVYDGYMLRNPGAPSRLSQCGAAPGASDQRRIVAKVDVPVIEVVAQGEVPDSLAQRRPDSDEPDNRFRRYEFAGTAHIDRWAYDRGFPNFADQAATGGNPQGTPEFPLNAKCDPPFTFSTDTRLKYAYDATLVNLDQWARKGKPAPHGNPIEIKDGAVALDAAGNGLGGVRSPWVDVPAATYFPGSTPAACREFGHTVEFDKARMDSLYGSDKNYQSKFSQSVDQLVKAGWFTESDGKKMKAEIVKK